MVLVVVGVEDYVESGFLCIFDYLVHAVHPSLLDGIIGSLSDMPHPGNWNAYGMEAGCPYGVKGGLRGGGIAPAGLVGHAAVDGVQLVAKVPAEAEVHGILDSAAEAVCVARAAGLAVLRNLDGCCAHARCSDVYRSRALFCVRVCGNVEHHRFLVICICAVRHRKPVLGVRWNADVGRCRGSNGERQAGCCVRQGEDQLVCAQGYGVRGLDVRCPFAGGCERDRCKYKKYLFHHKGYVS